MKKHVLSFISIFTVFTGLSFAVSAHATVSYELSDIVKASDVPNAAQVCYPGLDNDCLMKHDDASAYCASIGKRLPTDREFAAVGMSLGAVGIREAVYNDSYSPSGGGCVTPADMANEFFKNKAEGFLGVHDGFTPTNVPIGCDYKAFYFSSKGFTGPIAALAKYQDANGWERYFWSSDVYAKGTAVTFCDWNGINQQLSTGRVIHFESFGDDDFTHLPVLCTK